MSQDRTNRTLQASLIAFVALAVGALLAWAVWSGSDSEASAAPAGGQARLLTFTGTGTAHVQPDGASISAGVSTKGASADAAQDAASRRMAALVKHLRSVGVAKQDLQTSDASVNEDYEHEGRFSANQSLTIRVRDVDRAGELLGEATQGGADSVSGPAFSLEDQRAGYDEALRTAIADARAKADAAASHMDATVRSVYAIGEAGSTGERIPMLAATAGMATDAKAVDVPTEQGTQDVTLTVEVSFTYDR
ncbi:MAG: hypothetical protein JWM98_1779 [Thermoleophilia bacterium]|nr:hypothetical protein [Thermoleophilia bacterium]